MRTIQALFVGTIAGALVGGGVVAAFPAIGAAGLAIGGGITLVTTLLVRVAYAFPRVGPIAETAVSLVADVTGQVLLEILCG